MGGGKKGQRCDLIRHTKAIDHIKGVKTALGVGDHVHPLRTRLTKYFSDKPFELFGVVFNASQPVVIGVEHRISLLFQDVLDLPERLKTPHVL